MFEWETEEAISGAICQWGVPGSVRRFI
jgi:hypothetical protein